MAKDDKKQEKKTRTPEEIEAEKAAKVAKKAEMAAKAKEAVSATTSVSAEKPEGGKEEKAGKGKGPKGGGGAGKRRDEGGEAIAFPQGYLPRLKKKYTEEIAPALMNELKIKNKMALPRVEKI